MPIIDLIVLGRHKARLKRSIHELTEMARQEAARQGLPTGTSRLWDALCQCASDTLTHLLLGGKRDRAMDWGLKAHLGKVSRARLAVMYWWLLLYHMVLLRNRGIDGISVEDGLPELSRTSYSLMERLASLENLDIAMPAPWAEQWERQVSLEASLGLYNCVMEMLGIYLDLDKRINRVSLFTSATEKAYDATVRQGLSEKTS